MFSLIITIVSIALVIALAVATIYYGGESFKTAQARAVAAAVVTQGQQVLGAVELFRVHQGRWPSTKQELVDFGYLSSIPEPSDHLAVNGLFGGQIVGPAYAATDAEWSQVQTGAPAFWLLREVSESVCRNVNLHVRKDNGIFNAAKNELTIQCFGQNSNYTVLVHLPPQNPDLELDVIVPPNSGSPPLQVDPSGNGWSKPPDSNVVVAPPTPPTPAPVVRYYDAATNAVIASWAFADTAVGSSSVQKDVKVGNIGTADLLLQAPNFIVDSPFAVASSDCAPVLSPGQYCLIGLTYNPTTVGPASQQLSMVSNVSPAPSLLLTANGHELATVTSFVPTTVSTVSGQTITVSGTKFTAGTAVAIGGVSATTVVDSSTQLTITTPTLVPGNYPLTVTVPNAQVSQPSTLLNVVAPAPTISLISPTSGPTAGGTVVTVTGSQFQSGAQVLVAGAGVPTTYVSGTTLTFVTPANAPGDVNVQVSNNPPSGSVSSGATYTYMASGGTATTTATGMQLTSNLANFAGTSAGAYNFVAANFNFRTNAMSQTVFKTSGWGTTCGDTKMNMVSWTQMPNGNIAAIGHCTNMVKSYLLQVTAAGVLVGTPREIDGRVDALTVGSDNSLYYNTEETSGRFIRRIAANGAYTGGLGNGQDTTGMAADPTGSHIYFAVRQSATNFVLNKCNIVTSGTPCTSVNLGLLNYSSVVVSGVTIQARPYLVFDGSGQLYAATLSAIYKVDKTTGASTPYVGHASETGFVDGDGGVARFWIKSVGRGPDGKVYVHDQPGGLTAIRRID